jgi:DnaJ-class molecular chaperone
MKAVLCPVCCGRGTIPSQPVGVSLTENKCHGCGGLGWVTVPDDLWTMPYPKQKEKDDDPKI